VTELPEQTISREQLRRMCNRYVWAARFCDSRDVLEVACGSGRAIDYLASRARKVVAGDISPEILSKVATSASNVRLQVLDAQHLPFSDAEFDVVLISEALYYLPSAEKFVSEARRVLRPSGRLLIVVTNKDLYEFHRSPYSTVYHGVPALNDLLKRHGFNAEFFGYLNVDEVSWRQRILRPVKRVAEKFDLIPKTMRGKQLLKSIVFGAMMPMPERISEGLVPYEEPRRIVSDAPDVRHKIIYCAAIKSID